MKCFYFQFLFVVKGNVAIQTQSENQPLFGEKHGCFNGMVFDVGLPRTGTSSVAAFGAKLGFFSTHLMDVPFSEVKACLAGQSCSFYKKRAESLLQVQNSFMRK